MGSKRRMKTMLKVIAAAALIAAYGTAANAATEITWWHAMGGELGKKLDEIVAGYNASQDKYQVDRDLQGLLSGDHDGGDRGVPRAPAARHRAGLRGRHRHHDGRQGRDLSGLQADEGHRARLGSEGLPARRRRLLHRHRRQHAVDAVQLLDPDPLLQQGRVQEGRARPERRRRPGATWSPIPRS